MTIESAREPAVACADRCKIVVVDDDAGIRDSLDALLTAKGFTCEHFANAESFLAESAADDEAVILMDYSLEAMSGLEAIRRARASGDIRPVIMITAHGDIELAVEAMRAGASDFIEKPWDKDALSASINRAVEVAESVAGVSAKRKKAVDIIGSFTPREKEVFDQLITGASNKIVARALKLSPRTVEFYRANVFEKADVTSVAELVRLAFMARGAAL